MKYYRAATIGTVLILVASGVASSAGAAAAPRPPLPLGADFNGDGLADLAVDAEWARVGNHGAAGRIDIFYGSADGLGGDQVQRIDRNSPGIVGRPVDGGRFGSALTSGDFNADGFDDLVIGGESENDVYVVPGSTSGLLTDSSVRWTPHSRGMPFRHDTEGRGFGFAVTSADLDADGFDDLAVGMPYDRRSAVPNRFGSVRVLSGSRDGLSSAHITNVTERGKNDDSFGWDVAAGDFSGDGTPDLVVGAPYAWVVGRQEAGAIYVVPSDAAGPVRRPASRYSAATPGMHDEAHTFETFGQTVGSGDLNGDGIDDVFAAAYRADNRPGNGYVRVLFGSRPGLTTDDNQVWNSDALHAPPRDGTATAVGTSLVVADFDGDDFGDLVIGSSYDVEDGIVAGSVYVLHGSANGPTDRDEERWNQASEGISQDPDWEDIFGAAATAADFTGDGVPDLVVSAPSDNVNDVDNAGIVQILVRSSDGSTFTGDQVLTENMHGLPGHAIPDGFGDALAG